MTQTVPSATRVGTGLCAALALLGASTSALAQDYGQPSGYNGSPQGYGPPPNYDGPPPGYGPPSNYDPNAASGQPAPPPPQGYDEQDQRENYSAQAQAQDRAYAAAQEQWAAANCVRRAQDRAVAGTVIGGILGAIVGSNLAQGGGRTGGAIIGGALGAAAGNVLARDSGGGVCPQGYVVRSGAPVFAPPPGVVYEAPVDYNPWVWYGGRWIYRPYPYHRYWRRHHY